MITVYPVTTRRHRRQFVNLPWRLYKDDPNWVPPLKMDMHNTLNPKHNALLRLGPNCFFLAEREGRIVGRIGCGVDRLLNKAKGMEMGYITLLECEQDYAIAKLLFDVATGFLRRHGAELATGPQSPSNGDDYRALLIDGFDSPPVFLNSYNPPWYRDYLEKYGFTKHFDRYAYWVDLTEPIPERLQRGVAVAEKRFRFTVRPINMRDIPGEAAKIKVIADKATPEEWPDMISPSMEEIMAEFAKLKPVVVPELALIAETENGEPVGMGVSVPDYNQVIKKINGKLFPFGWLRFLLGKKHIDTIRVFAIMIVPDYHRRGVSAALYLKTLEAAKAMGYTGADCSSIHEFNVAMNRDAQGAGARLWKTFRVFQLPL